MSSQPGDFSEEAEDSQCCSFKLLVEEEGYEADSESNPEDGKTQDDGKISLKCLWLDLQAISLNSKMVHNNTTLEFCIALQFNKCVALSFYWSSQQSGIHICNNVI